MNQPNYFSQRNAVDKSFQGTVMALHHALSGELIDIRPLKGNLKNAPTKTLYKSNRLEVFRMVLLAGKTMPTHQVVGEVTVQCLEGSIELAVAGISQLMREGDLICLAGSETHGLKAVEDSSVLVTILLHGA
jgi:quercetin dioxygenase-like cupin family protein